MHNLQDTQKLSRRIITRDIVLYIQVHKCQKEGTGSIEQSVWAVYNVPVVEGCQLAVAEVVLGQAQKWRCCSSQDARTTEDSGSVILLQTRALTEAPGL